MVAMAPSTCLDKNGSKKRKWSPEERKKLIDHINKNGHGCWEKLPSPAGLNRSGKSCRMKWLNYLKPGIKKDKFSDEEDKKIIKLQSAHGNRWAKIAAELPGRTDNDVKNRWNNHLKKKLLKMGNDPTTYLNHQAADAFPLPANQLLQNQLLLFLTSMPDNVENTGLLENPCLYPFEACDNGTIQKILQNTQEHPTLEHGFGQPLHQYFGQSLHQQGLTRFGIGQCSHPSSRQQELPFVAQQENNEPQLFPQQFDDGVQGNNMLSNLQPHGGNGSSDTEAMGIDFGFPFEQADQDLNFSLENLNLQDSFSLEELIRPAADLGPTLPPVENFARMPQDVAFTAGFNNEGFNVEQAGQNLNFHDPRLENLNLQDSFSLEELIRPAADLGPTLPPVENFARMPQDVAFTAGFNNEGFNVEQAGQNLNFHDPRLENLNLQDSFSLEELIRPAGPTLPPVENFARMPQDVAFTAGFNNETLHRTYEQGRF